MIAIPSVTRWKKPQLLVPFKGRKGISLPRGGVWIRIRRNVDLRYEQYEAVRRILVKNIRGKKRAKNQKHERYLRMVVMKVRRKQVKRFKIERLRMLGKCRDIHVTKQKEALRFLLYPKICVPITQKPLQMRMGKGKGAIFGWLDRCRRNRVVLEFSARKLSLGKVKLLYEKVAQKLPRTGKFAYHFTGRRREFLIETHTFFKWYFTKVNNKV